MATCAPAPASRARESAVAMACTVRRASANVRRTAPSTKARLFGCWSATASKESASLMKVSWSRLERLGGGNGDRCLAGAQARGGVEADRLGVDVGVLDDEGAAVGELAHVAEAFGRLHLLLQRGEDLLVEAGDHRRQEQARRDRVDAHADGAELACRRHVHADDRGLRGGVGGLSDLAFIGGAGRDVDDDAALLAAFGL